MHCCAVLNPCTLHVALVDAADPDQRRTPEEYVITFPGKALDSPDYVSKYQLVITTSLPRNVTVRVSYYKDSSTASVTHFGPYVITNATDAMIWTETKVWSDVASTSDTATLASDDRVVVYAYSFFKKYVDAVRVRPVSQLGRKHFIVTPPSSQHAGWGKAFFQLTSPEPDNLVRITLPASLHSNCNLARELSTTGQLVSRAVTTPTTT